MNTRVEDLQPSLGLTSGGRLASCKEKLFAIGVCIDTHGCFLSTVTVVEIDVKDDDPVDVMLQMGWREGRPKGDRAN